MAPSIPHSHSVFFIILVVKYCIVRYSRKWITDFATMLQWIGQETNQKPRMASVVVLFSSFPFPELYAFTYCSKSNAFCCNLLRLISEARHDKRIVKGHHLSFYILQPCTLKAPFDFCFLIWTLVITHSCMWAHVWLLRRAKLLSVSARHLPDHVGVSLYQVSWYFIIKWKHLMKIIKWQSPR